MIATEPRLIPWRIVVDPYERLVTIRQAIEDYGRSRATLMRWLADGKLNRYRKPKDDAVYLSRGEIELVIRLSQPGRPKGKRKD